MLDQISKELRNEVRLRRLRDETFDASKSGGGAGGGAFATVIVIIVLALTIVAAASAADRPQGATGGAPMGFVVGKQFTAGVGGDSSVRQAACDSAMDLASRGMTAHKGYEESIIVAPEASSRYYIATDQCSCYVQPRHDKKVVAHCTVAFWVDEVVDKGHPNPGVPPGQLVP